jgi:hypothetical protein
LAGLFGIMGGRLLACSGEPLDQAGLPAPKRVEPSTSRRTVQALVQEQVEELPFLALDVRQLVPELH